jgi:hypothetical protein
MKTEIGEYVVGAYLKLILNCDVVDYNVRDRSGTRLQALGELDVIGLRFSDKTAYICEATTQVRGMQTTIEKIRDKHARQQSYVKQNLKDFTQHHFMLWSPCVKNKKKLNELGEINTLELVINENYTMKIDQLIAYAKENAGDTNNPFMRSLQLLEALKR